MRGLHEDAVIFCYSCSTGEGKRGRLNLANYVNILSGKPTYAFSAPASLSDIRISSYYPFVIHSKQYGDYVYKAELISPEMFSEDLVRVASGY